MNRRNFLHTAFSVAATGPALRSLAEPESNSEPRSEYFDRALLERLVDTSVATDNISFQVVAYNFPNYHPSAPQERYFGRGWTEWELLKRAKPLFEGHLQPKRPLWGYYNEADPAWAAREIEAASSAGINVFMVDWYWYKGTILLNEQLEQGFLKAPNRDRMKFAVMWVNISWNNQYPPPDSAANYAQCPVLYDVGYDDADIDRMIDYCIESYFAQPNYWRINDLPVLQVFAVDAITGHCGLARTRVILDRMRNRVARSGFKGLHIQGSNGYTPGRTHLRDAGFDSATDYQTMGGGNPGKISTYAEAVERTLDRWHHAATMLDVPYYPDCPVGWDDSPRYTNRSHVVVHRSPDQYEHLLQAAKCHVATYHCDPPIIYLSSWNEWSEDHYLLPDEVHGYGYLEVVKRQFGPRKASAAQG